MGDLLRIVRLPDPKRPVVLRDIADNVTYFPWRDPPIAITAPPEQAIRAQIERRYGGSRQVGAIHENASLARKIRIKGATADACILALEAIIAETEDHAGKYLEWRPDGATRSTYYELRGTATRDFEYAWATFAQGKALSTTLNFPIAPLSRGPALDIYDPFDVDSLADYTFDTGGGTIAVDPATRRLVPSTTAIKRFWHSARGHRCDDFQVTLMFRTGATGGTGIVRLGKRLDAANRIMVNLVSGFLGASTTDAGAESAGKGSNAAPALAANTTYWLRFRMEGNVVHGELFTAEPTPMGAPAAASLYQLSAADAVKFSDGVLGDAIVGLDAVPVDWRFGDLRIEPYTHRNRSLPESILLRGVPGTAPPAADLVITPSGGTSPPIFGLLAWTKRAALHNLVWNGGFEEDIDGWAVGGAYAQGAGVSLARVTTAGAAKYGSAALAITVPATIESGAHFPLYRRFKAGVTYTVSAWVRSPALTDAAQIYIAHPGGAGSSTGSVTLSTTHQLVTTTWTPGADIDRADLVIRHAPATAGVIHVDGVMAYEGTNAPTLGKHSEGQGAYPPFGILEAEACDPGALSTWAITADAAYLGGYGLKVTTSGAGSAAAEWYIDPSLLSADDFLSDELDIEVLARLQLHPSVVSPKLVLSARSELGADFGQERYATPHEATGKLLTIPTGGSAVFRPVKLGALRLDRTSETRTKLRIAGSWQAGSSGVVGLDYLWLVAQRSRAGSKTGVANDSGFPRFVASTAETTKTIGSDLKGYVAKPPRAPSRDHGLGGSLIELPAPTPGQASVDIELLAKLSSLVVDDPTANGSTEQLAHTATVHVAVVPRYFLARGG